MQQLDVVGSVEYLANINSKFQSEFEISELSFEVFTAGSAALYAAGLPSEKKTKHQDKLTAVKSMPN